MSDAEPEHGGEHQVTQLELFFDLVFVFAITPVTSLLAHDPTWHGVLRGMLVLAAVWGAWIGYAWLTSAIDVDDGGVRLAMLASMVSSSPGSSVETSPTAAARFCDSRRPRSSAPRSSC